MLFKLKRKRESAIVIFLQLVWIKKFYYFQLVSFEISFVKLYLFIKNDKLFVKTATITYSSKFLFSYLNEIFHQFFTEHKSNKIVFGNRPIHITIKGYERIIYRMKTESSELIRRLSVKADFSIAKQLIAILDLI